MVRRNTTSGAVDRIQQKVTTKLVNDGLTVVVDCNVSETTAWNTAVSLDLTGYRLVPAVCLSL